MRLDKGQIEMVDEAMAEVLRRKTPAERIAIGFEMWSSATKMLTAHLKSSHPDWSVDEVQREVAWRMSHGDIGDIEKELKKSDEGVKQK